MAYYARIISCLLVIAMVMHLGACSDQRQNKPQQEETNIVNENNKTTPLQEQQEKIEPATEQKEPMTEQKEPITEQKEPVTEQKEPATEQPVKEKTPTANLNAETKWEQIFSEIEVYSAGINSYYYDVETAEIPQFLKSLNLDQYEKAEPIQSLCYGDMESGPFIRLMNNNMQMLCIYQYQTQALFIDENGQEFYYNVPENAFETALESTRLYSKQSGYVENFDRTFLKVSIQQNFDGEPFALSKSETMQLMASLPLWQCNRADRKEILSTKNNMDGDFILLINENNEKIAIFKDKMQFKYINADGKVRYYDIGENGQLFFSSEYGHGRIEHEPYTVLYTMLLDAIEGLS